MEEDRPFYYVEKHGHGSPVLFLPAGGFLGNEGQNIADVIQNNFETHMLDLPGMGRGQGIKHRCKTKAMADWVKGYLDQEEINQVYVIGHSLGGAVGMAFAAHYPDRISKLVLLDQGHKPFPRIPKKEFGLFAYAFPVLSGCVRMFGRPVLQKLEPLFTAEPNEEVERDIEEEVRVFCESVHVSDNPYIHKAKEVLADFSIDGLNLMFGYYQMNLPKLLQYVETDTFLAYGTFEGLDAKEHKMTKRYIKRCKGVENLLIRPVKGGHYVHWAEEDLLKDIHAFLK